MPKLSKEDQAFWDGAFFTAMQFERPAGFKGFEGFIPGAIEAADAALKARAEHFTEEKEAKEKK